MVPIGLLTWRRERIHLSQSEAANWIEIRDAAFVVVALTRRKTGLWCLPTSPDELNVLYAPSGTREFKIRQLDDFGNASITVTLKALWSLASAVGTNPPFHSETLEALRAHREPGGGYGSAAFRKDGQATINPVARHTASALLLRLAWEEVRTSTLSVAELEKTFAWLLDNMLPDGGWAYDKNQPQSGMGMSSTASSIAALCRYIDMVPDIAGPHGSARISDGYSAVRKAYQALIQRADRGTWRGANDGVPFDRHVVDSAFCIGLLLDADKNGTLREAIGAELPGPETLLADFVASGTDDGWPASIDDKVGSVSATISALDLISSGRGSESDHLTKIRRAEDQVLTAWTHGRLEQTLRMWDWACLLTYASRKGGPLQEFDRDRHLKTVSAIRLAWEDNSLSTKHISLVTKRIRPTVKYSLTQGGRHPPKSYATSIVSGVNKELAVVLLFTALLLVAAMVLGVH